MRFISAHDTLHASAFLLPLILSSNGQHLPYPSCKFNTVFYEAAQVPSASQAQLVACSTHRECRKQYHPSHTANIRFVLDYLSNTRIQARAKLKLSCNNFYNGSQCKHAMGLYGLPPLREDQIRLVHIEKQENVKEIRCAVSIHLLGNKTHIPEFSALSYTWGSCHRVHCELRRLSDNRSNLRIGVTETIPQQFDAEGDKSHRTQQIVCNDESVDVTENLHDFLCYWTSSQNQSRNGYL